MVIQKQSPSRDRKLLTSRQFRAVYDRGRRFNTPYFSAFILRTDGCQQRVGITVTRKLGGAVVRNRCKRRMREIVRRHQGAGAGDVGYDMVINAKSDLYTGEFQQIAEAFDQTLARFRASLKKQGGAV